MCKLSKGQGEHHGANACARNGDGVLRGRKLGAECGNGRGENAERRHHGAPLRPRLLLQVCLRWLLLQESEQRVQHAQAAAW